MFLNFSRTLKVAFALIAAWFIVGQKFLTSLFITIVDANANALVFYFISPCKVKNLYKFENEPLIHVGVNL